MSFENQYATSY